MLWKQKHDGERKKHKRVRFSMCQMVSNAQDRHRYVSLIILVTMCERPLEHLLVYDTIVKEYFLWQSIPWHFWFDPTIPINVSEMAKLRMTWYQTHNMIYLEDKMVPMNSKSTNPQKQVRLESREKLDEICYNWTVRQGLPNPNDILLEQAGLKRTPVKPVRFVNTVPGDAETSNQNNVLKKKIGRQKTQVNQPNQGSSKSMVSEPLLPATRIEIDKRNRFNMDSSAYRRGCYNFDT